MGVAVDGDLCEDGSEGVRGVRGPLRTGLGALGSLDGLASIAGDEVGEALAGGGVGLEKEAAVAEAEVGGLAVVEG
jgi:hypothetical protein